MIETEMREKYRNLIKNLKNMKKITVAFSSGVDSTFLLKVAHDTLGKDNVTAVTAKSLSFPKREYEEAKDFCEINNIKHIIIETNELNINGFKENPINRCYICKKELFKSFLTVAEAFDNSILVEGSNADDAQDYRPGLMAIKELGIQSPLKDAGLTKEEIRYLSKELNLKTFEKPSFACLSSRFAYGETITEEKLEMVEKSEQLLYDIGIKQARVRIHGNKDFMARIEVLPNDMSLITDERNRLLIDQRLKEFGFSYVTLDLRGYRTGSMNETINKQSKSE